MGDEMGSAGDTDEVASEGLDLVREDCLKENKIKDGPICGLLCQKNQVLSLIEGSVHGVEGEKKGGGKKRGRKRKIKLEASVGKSVEASVGKSVEVLDGKSVVIGGRVLRSRMASKSNGEEMGDKTLAVVKVDSACGDINARLEDSMQSDNSVENGSVKRKRGRPPKSQENQLSLKKPGKVLGSGRKLKRKRGRPRKMQESSQSDDDDEPKSEHNRKDMGGSNTVSRKKLKLEHGTAAKLRDNTGSSNKSKKSEHETERSLVVYDNDVTENVKPEIPSKENGTPSEVDDNAKEREVIKKDLKKQASEQSRRTAKQAVRDRIVELILSAGWTIEYRPRNGRAYQDAVYVNPAGKTHWSVTLAYRVFKQEVENNGLPITLIPEEELLVLKKEIGKERKDKGMSRPKGEVQEKGKGKGKGTTDEVVITKKKLKTKLHKGKLLKEKYIKQKRKSASSPCKSLGRLKGTTPRGIQMLVRSHKRQETLTKKKSLEGASGYVLCEGKRNLLAWMIDLETLPLDGKVQYRNSEKSQVLCEGKITKEGIHCYCCSESFRISDFEIHAGSRLNKPFANLYLENGKSLLMCLLDSWNKQEKSESKGFHSVDVSSGDPNDDTCGICGDGGDLVCCDGCPSTFHQSCLDIRKVPSGDWFCMYCSCKFCGVVNEDSSRKQNEVAVAALSPLLTCSSCEQKYHWPCIDEKDSTPADDFNRLSFCGKKCQEIYKSLEKLLGIRHELQDGFSWTLLRRSEISEDVSPSEVSQKIECNSKLAVAFLVMDECFCPLDDHRSGINLIQNIVYSFGSNFQRLDYSGFFTAILERGDELIAAASVRIHGNQLAEMPFIGTRNMYRRQGMCRRLLTAIESVLRSLDVAKLVIPAVSEVKETWISGFGFEPLEESSRPKMKNLNMLVFPGVDLLQKLVPKEKSAEENMRPADNGVQNVNNVDDPCEAVDPLSCDISADLESRKEHLDGCHIHSNGVGLSVVNNKTVNAMNKSDVNLDGDVLETCGKSEETNQNCNGAKPGTSDLVALCT